MRFLSDYFVCQANQSIFSLTAVLILKIPVAALLDIADDYYRYYCHLFLRSDVMEAKQAILFFESPTKPTSTG